MFIRESLRPGCPKDPIHELSKSKTKAFANNIYYLDRSNYSLLWIGVCLCEDQAEE